MDENPLQPQVQQQKCGNVIPNEIADTEKKATAAADTDEKADIDEKR